MSNNPYNHYNLDLSDDSDFIQSPDSSMQKQSEPSLNSTQRKQSNEDQKNNDLGLKRKYSKLNEVMDEADNSPSQDKENKKEQEQLPELQPKRKISKKKKFGMKLKLKPTPDDTKNKNKPQQQQQQQEPAPVEQQKKKITKKKKFGLKLKLKPTGPKNDDQPAPQKPQDQQPQQQKSDGKPSKKKFKKKLPKLSLKKTSSKKLRSDENGELISRRGQRENRNIKNVIKTDLTYQPYIQGIPLKHEDLQIKCSLGKGAFGEVQQALHQPTGKYVGLKMCKTNMASEQFIKMAKIEIEAQRQCDSDFIVKQYGSYIEGEYFYIPMEYMNLGSLTSLIKQVKSIPEHILGLIIYQILKGLEYLHYKHDPKKQIIHRDIKSNNILINRKGEVKLADFGIAKIVEAAQMTKTQIGTQCLMSPEAINNEPYGISVDVWALGVTIVECTLGYNPYKEMQKRDELILMYDAILKGKPLEIPKTYSVALQNIVGAMMRKKPQERVTVKRLLQLKYFQRYEGSLEKAKKYFAMYLKTVEPEKNLSKNLSPIVKEGLPQIVQIGGKQ